MYKYWALLLEGKSTSHSASRILILQKELTLLPQPRPIHPEGKGYWYHDRRQAPKQSTSPLHAHILEHLFDEERESCGDR